MPPLPGAAPGVQPFVPLTPISTPEAARAALTAEANTSVVDPVGMRRLWVRELDLLVVAGLVVAAVVAGVQFITNGQLPGWWLILMLLTFLVNFSTGYLPSALSRSLPVPELIPPFGLARCAGTASCATSPRSCPRRRSGHQAPRPTRYCPGPPALTPSPPAGCVNGSGSERTLALPGWPRCGGRAGSLVGAAASGWRRYPSCI